MADVYGVPAGWGGEGASWETACPHSRPQKELGQAHLRPQSDQEGRFLTHMELWPPLLWVVSPLTAPTPPAHPHSHILQTQDGEVLFSPVLLESSSENVGVTCGGARIPSGSEPDHSVWGTLQLPTGLPHFSGPPVFHSVKWAEVPHSCLLGLGGCEANPNPKH